MKPFVLLLPACLALAACGGSQSQSSQSADMAKPDMAQQNMQPTDGRFECQNGLAVNIAYQGEQVSITLDDKTAMLYPARAASGELYGTDKGLFGKVTEWHQKGGEAFLMFEDPYGNSVETTCRK
ncbi:MAG: MliC family protein [Cardiobacteriaceae bacterium]|nr:MliC family protein [Cardiobacteriaceae bacterium]